MQRFTTLLKSKTVWSAIGMAVVHVAQQPVIRLPQIIEGILMVTGAIGVRDAIGRAGAK